MDVKANGQPADSYEQRDDLALHSAAGDPTVDRHSTSPTRNPHAKQLSTSELEAAQKQPGERTGSQNGKSSPSTNGLKTKGQPQAKEHLNSSKSKRNETKQKKTQSTENATGSLPDFIVKRNELFDRLKLEHHSEVLAKEKPEIDVVLDLGLDKDGRPRPEMPVAAKAWESTPGSFLRHVDKDISSDVVIAKVDGKQLWDLDRPLEYACRVSYVPFSSPEGRNVFWHSSAHVLGEAAECQFNCLLSHGPPVEQGFFYDMAIGDG